MNLENFLQQIVSFTGTFNYRLVIILFLICAIGEFSFSIPYLMETTWLLCGYNFGKSPDSYIYLVILWLVALAGRQIGAMTLYYCSRIGSSPLQRMYQKFLSSVLMSRLSANNGRATRFVRRINYLSPFSVAAGRFLWLRLPLTLTLGARKQAKTLVLSILLSSVVWDGIYISLGIIGGTAQLKPLQMLLYSLLGLTLVYVATFVSKQIARHRSPSGSETP